MLPGSMMPSVSPTPAVNSAANAALPGYGRCPMMWNSTYLERTQWPYTYGDTQSVRLHSTCVGERYSLRHVQVWESDDAKHDESQPHQRP